MEPEVPALTKACGLLQHTAAYEALLRGCMMLCGAAAVSSQRGQHHQAPHLLPAVTACAHVMISFESPSNATKMGYQASLCGCMMLCGAAGALL